MAYKTDEQLLEEYLPKLKTFTDERLTDENAKRIYDFLKPYHYDTDGWLLYKAAKNILQTDAISEFPAEDNLGFFEVLDGYGLLKWLEIAKFADKEYEYLRGGYELLKSHTLDENSPKYQEYQKALWPTAVRSITDDLTEKQPYLLEGFWNRLSYIENILMKGFPTRGELNEKIVQEAKRVFDAASEDDLTSFHSEVEIKTQIRNELCDTSITDERIYALWVKDDAIEDAYRFFVEESKDNQVYLAVWEYLEKAEHDYLADRLYDRAKLEYEDYVDRVKEMPVDKVIEEAYKLTIMYDLQISLEFAHQYEPETIKALYSLPSPLVSLYDEWMKGGGSHMDEIRNVIFDVANERAAEIKEKGFEPDTEPDHEDEEGLEL